LKHAATARPNKAPPPATLLAAACRIVTIDGLAGLALRPLAQALDVSVTVLTNHYGTRADVLAAICAAAADCDAAALDGWRAMLAPLPATLPPALAADLLEAVLEDQATRHRDLSVLFLEMLHACTWEDALWPAMAHWFAVRRTFWHEVGRQARVAPDLIACGWWHGYVIAEQAYGVVLDGAGTYRLLRRLCLQRIVAGGAAAGPQAADATLFTLLAQQMQQMQQMQQAGVANAPATPAPRRPDWYGAAARACGIRLAAQGVGALTHRAIAADIGIAHSTLSYRYPAQHDLVLAGLESIIAHIVTAVDADDLDQLQRLRTDNDGDQLDLARASLAVAIAAARMPDLAGCVADLRSRRGGNLVKVFSKYLPHASGIDALAAHVVSMGLTGLTITEPPGAASEQTVATAFAAAGRWLAA
jgi:AcrR family transcriptional regulator